MKTRSPKHNLMRCKATLLAAVLLVAGKGQAGMFDGEVITLPGTSFGEGAAFADFNKDGLMDVVVVTGNSSPDVVYLNNGPGQTWTRIDLPGAGTDATDVTVGDFDNDTRLDIAVSTVNALDVIYWNNSNGTWTQAFLPGPSTAAYGIGSGNLDLNNRRDIVVATGIGEDHVLYSNSGSRTFSRASLPSGSSTVKNARDVAVADINGDGRLDLFFSSVDTVDWVLEGTASGGFAIPTTSQIDGITGANAVVAGEFNMTPGADLLVLTRDARDTWARFEDFVTYFMGIPIYNVRYVDNFLASLPPEGTAAREHAAVGELDGFLGEDAVVVRRNALDFVYLNTNPGGSSIAFAVGETIPGTLASRAVALEDIDGDGDLDLLVATHGEPDIIRLNTTSVPESDFDNDGIPDALDPDDDNDGVPDELDPAPYSLLVCGDLDGDGCDDCSAGFGFDPWNDGPDMDVDGLCDSGDPDADGDGVMAGVDVDDLNPLVCADDDSDGCDDCSAGFGYDPWNDGPDNDADGLCDSGDVDDDNDGMPDTWELANDTDPWVDDAQQNYDNDSLTNYQEYVNGSDPWNHGDVGPRLVSFFDRTDGQFKLQFTAAAAVGPGYEGRARYFSVEVASVLCTPDLWTTVLVDGQTEILGDGSVKTIAGLDFGGPDPKLYRLVMRLHP